MGQVTNKKIKIPEIRFNNSQAMSHLSTEGKVFTLRTKQFKDRIHEVKSRHLTQNTKLYAHVRFVKEVEICATKNNIPNFIVCLPVEALKPYEKESGFYDDSEWLQTLQKFEIQIPDYPKTRTFFLHKVTKI